jgi:hypothetical protein
MDRNAEASRTDIEVEERDDLAGEDAAELKRAMEEEKAYDSTLGNETAPPSLRQTSYSKS